MCRQVCPVPVELSVQHSADSDTNEHVWYPPKMECGCLHGDLIENGRACNPLTLCSVPVLVHVQVLVHIPGDRVQLRNATTTTCVVCPQVCPVPVERGAVHSADRGSAGHGEGGRILQDVGDGGRAGDLPWHPRHLPGE